MRPLPAALLDLLCLAAFVLAGRQSHEIESGLGWYATVIWPFVAGWFAVALVVGLYRPGNQGWRRLAITVLLGVGLALVLRAALTARPTPVAFVLVAFGFIALATAGWRLLARVAPRRLARRR